MQTFFRVVFPVMRPINIVVLVITFIEALRAFDLVWVVNKGRNGLELISALVTHNIVGEASRIGFGSALATIMLVVSIGLRRDLPADRPAEERRLVSHHDRGPADDQQWTTAGGPGPAAQRVALAAATRFLIVMALAWLFPVLWALLSSSFRDYQYTSVHGYVSLGGWTLDNYANAWEQADFTRHFLNSLYITVPAVP